MNITTRPDISYFDRAELMESQVPGLVFPGGEWTRIYIVRGYLASRLRIPGMFVCLYDARTGIPYPAARFGDN